MMRFCVDPRMPSLTVQDCGAQLQLLSALIFQEKIDPDGLTLTTEQANMLADNLEAIARGLESALVFLADPVAERV